jgi:Tfp pilus assembly protein PilE
MKLLAVWNISIDDEFRDYLNLLASIAVLFILTALALNVYQNYSAKARLVKTYMDMLAYKNFVHEYYGVIQQLPSEAVLRREFVEAESEFTRPSPHITYSDISFTEGAITLSFADKHPDVDGTRLTLRPVVSENTGTVQWLCGYARLPTITDVVNTETTIPKKFLVNICRE